MPYLRVETGFVDIFLDEYQFLTDEEMEQTEVIEVDRSLIWKAGVEEGFNQVMVEQAIKDALAKYKKLKLRKFTKEDQLLLFDINEYKEIKNG